MSCQMLLRLKVLTFFSKCNKCKGKLESSEHTHTGGPQPTHSEHEQQLLSPSQNHVKTQQVTQSSARHRREEEQPRYERASLDATPLLSKQIRFLENKFCFKVIYVKLLQL